VISAPLAVLHQPGLVSAAVRAYTSVKNDTPGAVTRERLCAELDAPAQEERAIVRAQVEGIRQGADPAIP
jgi:hypothetical protein